jgi:hypothetical protein
MNFPPMCEMACGELGFSLVYPAALLKRRAALVGIAYINGKGIASGYPTSSLARWTRPARYGIATRTALRDR